MKPFYSNHCLSTVTAVSQHWPHHVLLYGNETSQHFLSAGTAVSQHLHSHFWLYGNQALNQKLKLKHQNLIGIISFFNIMQKNFHSIATSI